MHIPNNEAAVYQLEHRLELTTIKKEEIGMLMMEEMQAIKQSFRI